MRICVTPLARSRFLLQATFGPTQAAVNALGASLSGASRETAFEDWIAAQMALPAQLHRAYYRQRANPR